MSCGRPEAIAAVLLAALAASPAASGAWPSFHGDALGIGAIPGAAALGLHAPFEEVWWTAKAPDSAAVAASPVAKDGLVVVADTKGVVRALDARSGTEEWRAKMPAGVEGTPAIAAEHVYVVDTAGNLRSFSLLTGALEASAAAGPTRGSIAEHEGKLFVGNEAGEVRAFLSDLSPLWTFKVNDVRFEGPTVHNVTSCAPSVAALQPVRGRPAVFDGSVYFGSLNHYVYAVDEAGQGDLKTRLLWAYQTGDLVDASPALVSTASEDLIVAGSYDGTVYSFKAHQDGEGAGPCATRAEAAWTYDAKSSTTLAGTEQPTKIHSSAATDGLRVFVGTNGGDLLALSAEDGTKLWAARLGGPFDGVRSSPAVGNGTVVVGSDDARVYWLDPANGTVQRNYTASSQVSSSAALEGGLAFISGRDGTTYAFGPQRPPEPDLVVRKVALNLTRLTATVDNDGSLASNATALLRVSSDGRLLAELEVPVIAAGASKTLSSDQDFAPGLYHLTAVLDPTDTVEERNEANNAYARNMTLLAPKVDGNETGNQTNGTGGGKGKFLGIPGPEPLAVASLLVAVALLVRRRRGG